MRTIDADSLKQEILKIPITTNDVIMMTAWEAFKKRVNVLIDNQPTIMESEVKDGAY